MHPKNDNPFRIINALALFAWAVAAFVAWRLYA